MDRWDDLQTLAWAAVDVVRLCPHLQRWNCITLERAKGNRHSGWVWAARLVMPRDEGKKVEYVWTRFGCISCLCCWGLKRVYITTSSLAVASILMMLIVLRHSICPVIFARKLRGRVWELFYEQAPFSPQMKREDVNVNHAHVDEDCLINTSQHWWMGQVEARVFVWWALMMNNSLYILILI